MLVEITIGNKKRKVSTREAILLRQRKKALDGDQRATEFLDAKFSQFEPIIIEPDQTRKLLAEDIAILENATARGLLDLMIEDNLPAAATNREGRPDE